MVGLSGQLASPPQIDATRTPNGCGLRYLASCRSVALAAARRSWGCGHGWDCGRGFRDGNEPRARRHPRRRSRSGSRSHGAHGADHVLMARSPRSVCLRAPLAARCGVSTRAMPWAATHGARGAVHSHRCMPVAVASRATRRAQARLAERAPVYKRAGRPNRDFQHAN